MATIKFSGLVTGAAGKVGGQILQRGRTGYQLRNLTQPRKLLTDSLSTSQAYLAAYSRAWSLLSEANRQQWEGLAATLTRFNRFGEAYTPTGYQVFIEYNKTESLLDPSALFVVPPAPLAPVPITNAVLVAEVGPDNFRAQWDNPLSDTAQTVAVFMFGVTPAGQSAAHRTPVWLRVSAPIQDEEAVLTGAIQKAFPRALNAGLRVTIGLRVYAGGHGLAGPMFMASEIVTS